MNKLWSDLFLENSWEKAERKRGGVGMNNQRDSDEKRPKNRQTFRQGVQGKKRKSESRRKPQVARGRGKEGKEEGWAGPS